MPEAMVRRAWTELSDGHTVKAMITTIACRFDVSSSAMWWRLYS